MPTQALVESLHQSGFAIPTGFAEGFRWRLARYHRERDQSLFETTYFSVLREMLIEQGYGSPGDAAVRNALDALYAVTQSNWEIEEDAISMLMKLKAEGLRLGMVSNAGDDKDVKTLTRRFHIHHYFDFVITSAACGYRKPHPRIFELALAHWRFPASEVVMAGDTLDADILGARQAGIYSIWCTANISASQSPALILPDATVSHLIEIPEVVARLTEP